jgi:hypothetical protein
MLSGLGKYECNLHTKSQIPRKAARVQMGDVLYQLTGFSKEIVLHVLQHYLISACVAK